jgi:hypothetical protein
MVIDEISTLAVKIASQFRAIDEETANRGPYSLQLCFPHLHSNMRTVLPVWGFSI